VNGHEGAAGGGHVRIGEAADDEVAGRARDRERTVEVALVLRCGAGEVERDLVFRDGGRGTDREVALGGLQHILRLETAVG
jgi:hypothetical protein